MARGDSRSFRHGSGASRIAILESILASSKEHSIIALDLDGRILVWNEGACRIHGYAANDVLAKEAAGILHVAEDVRSGRVAAMYEAARSRGHWEGELELARASGGRFHAHLALSLRRDTNDEPIGFTIISRVLTAGERVEHELRRSESRFKHILESAPDPLVIVDRHGRIVIVNRQTEHVFGYARDEMIDEPVEMLIPNRFHARHVDHRNRFFENPRIRPMGAGIDLFGLRKDGSEFPIEVSLSPFQAEEGILISSSIRDITAQKRMAAELEEQYQRVREANRLKSEFLANMSHELRTPLNAIIGFAQLMHDGRVGPISTTHQEYLGDILASSRHLLQLINDVLDLSKVEAGKMEFHPERVFIPTLVGELRDILRTLAAQKSISIEAELAEDVASVVTDPDRLKQILYNYLSNAIKFTPNGGRVVIRSKRQGEEAFRIEVEDTGIGIDPVDRDKLFVEFRQLDSGTRKKFSGTGLGLALTRRIVEAQGGEVGVTSTPGKGSIFHAILPKAASDEAAVSSRGAPRATSEEGAPDEGASPQLPSRKFERVLVVSSESIHRSDPLVDALDHLGLAAVAVRNGSEAAVAARDGIFDLAFLDLASFHAAPVAELQVMHECVVAEKATIFVVERRTGSPGISLLRIAGALSKPLGKTRLATSLAPLELRKRPPGRVMVIDADRALLLRVAKAIEKAGHEAVCETSASHAAPNLESAAADVLVIDPFQGGADSFDFAVACRARESGRRPEVYLWSAIRSTPPIDFASRGAGTERPGTFGDLVPRLRAELLMENENPELSEPPQQFRSGAKRR